MLCIQIILSYLGYILPVIGVDIIPYVQLLFFEKQNSKISHLWACRWLFLCL